MATVRWAVTATAGVAPIRATFTVALTPAESRAIGAGLQEVGAAVAAAVVALRGAAAVAGLSHAQQYQTWDKSVLGGWTEASPATVTAAVAHRAWLLASTPAAAAALAVAVRATCAAALALAALAAVGDVDASPTPGEVAASAVALADRARAAQGRLDSKADYAARQRADDQLAVARDVRAREVAQARRLRGAAPLPGVFCPSFALDARPPVALPPEPPPEWL